MPVAPLVDSSLTSRSVRVRAKDVVFVKGLLEASEGLGALFAERGGDLVIAAHPSRELELEELLADLVREIGAIIERRSDNTSDSLNV
ncbi:MAG: DUF4911 domain-containing protein [Polyangiaceae bacterium]|nr:DUF4911 domain-containing protein [Polyangiaceae bacterium]MCK6533388.1 DUF4911 domain-containing protein [Polyangiaceae bacterium]